MRHNGVIRSFRKEDGFTYLAALFMVAVIGIALSVTSEVWSGVVKREREEELIFRGTQMRDAIKSYYDSSPGKSVIPPVPTQPPIGPRLSPAKGPIRRIYDDPM